MASATRAWENQNWSSLTSTTTPARDERAQGAEQVGLLGLGHDEQRLERRRPAVHGERLDDPAPAVVEALELLAHRLLERPRQLGLEQLGHHRPRPDDAHQLLDDERDAGAAPVEGLDERRRRLRPPAGGDRRDHRPDLGAVEAVEAHLLDGVAALEAQHELAAGLAAGQVVGPVRGDDHEVRPRLLGDAVDQVGAGGVDPVEVLDDEHGRARRRRRRPRASNTAAARSSPVSAGVDERRRRRPAGRPSSPAGRSTPIVVTRAGSDSTSSRTRRVLPMPGLARDEGDGRLVDVITSAASTIPASRANGRARPTMTGLIPTRPLSTASTLEGISSRGVWDRAIDRSRSAVGSPSAPDRCGGREPGGRTVRRHAGRDRWGRAPPGEVGGARGWSMGARRSAGVSRCRRKKPRMPVAANGVELVGAAAPAGQLGDAELGDPDVHLGVHADRWCGPKAPGHIGRPTYSSGCPRDRPRSLRVTAVIGDGRVAPSRSRTEPSH